MDCWDSVYELRIENFNVVHFAFSGVEAIQCYQCNSYEQKDCLNLGMVRQGHSQNDTKALTDGHKYLKECVPGVGMRSQLAGEEAFCRKTVFTVDSNREQRIVRGCGWLRESNPAMHNSCYNADSGGYTEVICTCTENSCNRTASTHTPSLLLVGWSSILAALLLSSITKAT